MATSPNQLGTEGRSSDAIWRWTDGCVILPVFSLVSKIEDFSSSKETHFCLFYKGFPSFLSLYLYCLLVFISLRIPWDWWALELDIRPFGPEKPERVIIATTDPVSLPDLTTIYLVTNLPALGSERAQKSELAVASLEEVVRLYGLRMWVEQSYKQVKYALGWSEYQVRSDRAIRRHWQLVCCAFSHLVVSSGPSCSGRTTPCSARASSSGSARAARGQD